MPDDINYESDQEKELKKLLADGGLLMSWDGRTAVIKTFTLDDVKKEATVSLDTYEFDAIKRIFYKVIS